LHCKVATLIILVEVELTVVPSCYLPVHLFRHFCCRIYRLATMHSVTDRQTDRQTA